MGAAYRVPYEEWLTGKVLKFEAIEAPLYKFEMLVSGLRNTRLFTKGAWVGMGSWKTVCMGVGFALEKRAEDRGEVGWREQRVL